MYGLASPAKRHILDEFGATFVDYHDPDWYRRCAGWSLMALDYVFNGMADQYFAPGLAVLRRGGVLVHYAAPESYAQLARLVARDFVLQLLLRMANRLKVTHSPDWH
ncbi:MAG: hypothetical protein R3C44_22340 [Chloroflexota bacterium]